VFCAVLLALSAAVPTPRPLQQPPKPSNSRPTLTADGECETTRDAEQQAATAQKDPEPTPSRKEDHSNSGYIARCTNKKNENPNVGWFESHEAWATWLMAVGTCAAAVIVLFYTCYARTQARVMTKALEFGSRAWISIAALDTEFPTQDAIRFILKLKNSGKASAKGTVELSLRQLPAGASPSWEEESGSIVPTPDHVNFFAPPDVPVTAARYDFPPNLNWDGIRKGQTSLWIMIKVSYDDILAANRIFWAAARLIADDTGRPRWENPPPGMIRFT
jgi:hypothetical protein